MWVNEHIITDFGTVFEIMGRPGTNFDNNNYLGFRVTLAGGLKELGVFIFDDDTSTKFSTKLDWVKLHEMMVNYKPPQHVYFDDVAPKDVLEEAVDS